LNYRPVAVAAAAVTAVMVVVFLFFVISLSSYFLFHLFFHFPLSTRRRPEVFAVVVFVVPRCTRLITEPHQRSQ